jgi:hypothetical protein
MFDFTVTLDKPVFADGDPVTLTVEPAVEGQQITVDVVKYSLHEWAPDPDHPDGGMYVGDPIAYRCDGRTAVGTHRAGHGMLYVHCVDDTGKDAATYVPVPMPRTRRGRAVS